MSDVLPKRADRHYVLPSFPSVEVFDVGRKEAGTPRLRSSREQVTKGHTSRDKFYWAVEDDGQDDNYWCCGGSLLLRGF